MRPSGSWQNPLHWSQGCDESKGAGIRCDQCPLCSRFNHCSNQARQIRAHALRHLKFQWSLSISSCAGAVISRKPANLTRRSWRPRRQPWPASHPGDCLCSADDCQCIFYCSPVTYLRHDSHVPLVIVLSLIVWGSCQCGFDGCQPCYLAHWINILSTNWGEVGWSGSTWTTGERWWVSVEPCRDGSARYVVQCRCGWDGHWLGADETTVTDWWTHPITWTMCQASKQVLVSGKWLGCCVNCSGAVSLEVTLMT